ncbi:MAG: class I SAM-dependent methyltransferase [Prosthecobacter sp.]|nr:class I SAM-dependent methyltransferase [Prosthecobacter sp.]
MKLAQSKTRPKLFPYASDKPSIVLEVYFAIYNAASSALINMNLERKNEELDKCLAKTYTNSTPRHLGGHRNVTHTDAGALAWLQFKFNIKSMVDIGCGPGGMQAIARGMSIQWQGIDGDPQLKREAVIIHDYCTSSLELAPVDLAWSVEFLEHVEESYIPNFMKTFACARYSFVTHALPGKKGWHHVNCQKPDYWIDVFAYHGFMFDQNATQELRSRSTMKRDFVRANGLFFRNKKQAEVICLR